MTLALPLPSRCRGPMEPTWERRLFPALVYAAQAAGLAVEILGNTQPLPMSSGRPVLLWHPGLYYLIEESIATHFIVYDHKQMWPYVDEEATDLRPYSYENVRAIACSAPGQEAVTREVFDPKADVIAPIGFPVAKEVVQATIEKSTPPRREDLILVVGRPHGDNLFRLALRFAVTHLVPAGYDVEFCAPLGAEYPCPPPETDPHAPPELALANYSQEQYWQRCSEATAVVSFSIGTSCTSLYEAHLCGARVIAPQGDGLAPFTDAIYRDLFPLYCFEDVMTLLEMDAPEDPVEEKWFDPRAVGQRLSVDILSRLT